MSKQIEIDGVMEFKMYCLMEEQRKFGINFAKEYECDYRCINDKKVCPYLRVKGALKEVIIRI